MTTTWFFKDVGTGGTFNDGTLSLTDPGATTMNTGWTTAKIAAANFSVVLYATVRPSATFGTSDPFPAENPNVSINDCFFSEAALNTTIPAGNWVCTLALRAGTATTQAGRWRARLFKTSNNQGGGPSEFSPAYGAGNVGSTTGTITTTATQTSVITFSLGAITFANQFLCVLFEWEITTAGTSNGSDVRIRASESNLVIPSAPVVPIWGWDQQEGERFYPRQFSSMRRAGAVMRGDDGTESSFVRFVPNFDTQDSQDNVLTKWFNPRAQGSGALARGDDGNEAPLIQFLPVGFDQVASQDRHPRPERTGAIARGDDGAELPVPRPAVGWGFDQQDGMRITKRNFPRERRAGGTMRGEDGTESPFIPFLPVGFEEVFSQDRHPALLHRPGAILRGHDGIELPIPPPPVPWFEVTPPFLAHPRPERNGAFARWIDGTLPFVPFIPDGFEQVFSQDRHPTFLHRPGAIFRGDDGIVSPLPPPPIPWFEITPPFLAHLRPERNGALARWIDGTLPFVPFIPDGWEQIATQPLHRSFKSPEFGDAGIASPFAQFLPVGFDQVASQDAHRRVERAGALARWLDGTESPFRPPPVAFFDVTASQPAFPRTRTYGALMPKADGIESPFVQFFPVGWEQVASQDRHPRPERNGALARWIDGTLPFVPFIPVGWEQVATQPLYRPFRSPDVGDAGIANTFTAVGPVAFVNWGFDAQPPQPPHLRTERSGSVQLGDAGIASPFTAFAPLFETSPPLLFHRGFRAPEFGDGGIANPFVPPTTPWFETVLPLLFRRSFRAPEFGDAGIESPLIRFLPFEWPSVPIYRHPRPERSGAVARGEDGVALPFAPPLSWFETSPSLTRRAVFKSPEFGDPGIVSPLIRFLPFEWPWQPMYRHPRPEQSGAVARWEDGIARPFVTPTPWFETTPALTRHAMFRAPEFGDQGIQSSLIVPFPEGWQVQHLQPPHPRSERAGSIMLGDTGTENTFTAVGPVVYVNWGFDAVYPPQPPHPRRERSGSVQLGDAGIEAKFVPPTVYVGWGFDVQPVQPPRRRVERFAAIKGRITLPVFAPFIKSGFDQVFTQPPHPRPERSGVMLGDTGTESPFVFVAPPLTWGYGFEPLMFRRPAALAKLSTLLKGDDGIAATAITFYPQGWPVQPWQPPHPRPERSGAIMVGDVGGIDAAQIAFYPHGWPIQSPQPPHPRPERSGAIAKGDEGIETPLGFVPPVVYVGWGFEPIPPQPPHPRPERAGTIMLGEPGNELPFVVWRNAGWEVQPWQPPHPWWEKRGATLKGDEGIERFFVPPAPPFGWVVQPWQPPHRAPELKHGAIAKGDDGTQAPLVQFYPHGWPVQPPQPPRRWHERRGLFLRGDEGTQAKLIRFFPLLQEPTPPLFFRRPLPRVPVFMLDSVEQFGVFVPTVAPSVVCVRIAPYGAATTIGAMELKTIIKAFKAATIIKRQDCT